MAMDKEERKVFEQMSKALERVSKAQEEMSRAQDRMANVMEKQQPSKATQAVDTIVAVTAISGILSAVDLVIKWITGGCYANAIDFDNRVVRGFRSSLDFAMPDEKR
jgi:hypothetical protein